MTALSGGTRPTGILIAATVGVYALIMAGATTAITEAAAACGTWPTCNGQWLVPLDDPFLLLAWGHRLLALLVAGLVMAAAIVGWRTESTRIRIVLGIAVLLYPVQILLGAVTVTTTGSPLLANLHLTVGIGIFLGLILALVWVLDDESATAGSAGGDLTAPSTTEVQQPAGRVPPSTRFHAIRRTLWAYIQLMKPRLMWLLCLVAAAGMALAAGPQLTLKTVAATLAGGVLAIGASGTFNHVIERDIDRRMQRTADRPLATDQVGVRNALLFGSLLTIASIGTFLTINLLAAGLGLAAILYYSVVYTILLKPNTAQNTVIGGLAGAFPAVIGAAAATNRIGFPALLLALVIFLWTPAHFYNLALAYKSDYARAGFPMLPVVHGEAKTRRHILLYAGATFVAAAGLLAVSDLGWLYALTSVVFGAVFLVAVVTLHRDRSPKAAIRSFHASNAYLGMLLVAILVDAIVL